MLAVVAISLSSCKKDDVNYAQDFVGTYSMTLTPSITATVPVPGMGELPIEDFDSFDGVKCTIKETVSNSVMVTIVVENVPLFNIKGTCDEAGMHLDTYKFNQTIIAGEELGNLALNISLGSATVAAPTNGKIFIKSLFLPNSKFLPTAAIIVIFISISLKEMVIVDFSL